jgi:hypothetical protein
MAGKNAGAVLMRGCRSLVETRVLLNDPCWTGRAAASALTTGAGHWPWGGS